MESSRFYEFDKNVSVKAENILRVKAARTYEALLVVIGAVIKRITATDAQNWMSIPCMYGIYLRIAQIEARL